MAFTPDLCSAWLIDYQTPPPTADGQEGYRNLYRRENCGPDAGSWKRWRRIRRAAGRDDGDYVDNRSVQGTSEDARHAIFVAEAKLTVKPRPAPTLSSTIASKARTTWSACCLTAAPATGPRRGKGFAAWAERSREWLGLQPQGRGLGRRLAGLLDPGGEPGRQIYLREHPEQGIVPGECIEGGGLHGRGQRRRRCLLLGCRPGRRGRPLLRRRGPLLFDLESETSEPVAKDVGA